ncbi:hypothetical protein MTP04_22800 [Lysinibacillus sp. PLM2]|nr:hypothetical protein MTP04_22800 [Lysinibacillus sp. PLM2]
MSKFQVGDKVEVMESHGKLNQGDILKVLEVDVMDSVQPYLLGNQDKQSWAPQRKLKLVSQKKTKNQRITALEKEVSDLKIIVEELRGCQGIDFSPLFEPSTDEIIEFESNQYRKVDREARERDLVVFKRENDYYKSGKPYQVLSNVQFVDEDGDEQDVYNVFNRKPQYVDVYELIKQKPTPNQKRAEIIEKAKKFVEKTLAHGRSNNRTVRVGNSTYRSNFYDVDFFVKGNKVTAVVYWLAMNKIRVEKPSHVGRSQCNPSDVFNEHIGKAIALGRALGLDVSEFEQAVQPTEIVVGMVAKGKVTGRIYNIKIARNKDHIVAKEHDGTVGNDHASASSVTIINDTNAIY